MAAKRPDSRTQAIRRPAEPERRPSGRRSVARFWLWATAAGLLLRLALIPLSPRFPWTDDHDDFVRWGIQATDEGVSTLYDHPPPRWDRRRWQNGRWLVDQRKFDQLCNYPPLSVYLLYGAGLVFKAVSEDRLINTVASRAIFSGASIFADLLLAAGCAALVGCFRPGRAARAAYLLVLLLPPIWWDSLFWGQMDSVMLAPAVWMLWALVQRRWLVAGVFFGLAAALKPQALLLLPVWALAAGMSRPFWKPLAALPVAVAVLLVSALPFTLHSGWDWWQISYVSNLLEIYPKTTLKAFNLWYLDLLLGGSEDVASRWVGITKDVWGKALLLAALGAGLVWLRRRWRREPGGLVLWTALSLLAFVMLPTRVHERYLVVALPFLTVAAVLWRRLWPGWLMLLVVATSQVTWPNWMVYDAGRLGAFERNAPQWYQDTLAALPPERRERFPSLEEQLAAGRRQILQARAKTVGYEWFVTVLALVGAAATAVSAVRLKPDPPGTRDAHQASTRQGLHASESRKRPR